MKLRRTFSTILLIGGLIFIIYYVFFPKGNYREPLLGIATLIYGLDNIISYIFNHTMYTGPLIFTNTPENAFQRLLYFFVGIAACVMGAYKLMSINHN